MFAYRKKKNDSGNTRSKSHPKITHDFIKNAESVFLKNGGVITKITDEDVRTRKLEGLDFLDGNETFEFLNGE